jgi:glutathione synthase/RimK-type ligase-like ATP-grasp enzyme
VVIVGGKAIGGMKRSAVGDEFRSNFSLGGNVEVWNLSEKERELAEKVARVCGLDYGGVDIMKNPKSQNLNSKEYKEEDYENYILEVNRQCQFQGFEKATGINVAKKVVEMIKSRQ